MFRHQAIRIITPIRQFRAIHSGRSIFSTTSSKMIKPYVKNRAFHTTVISPFNPPIIYHLTNQIRRYGKSSKNIFSNSRYHKYFSTDNAKHDNDVNSRRIHRLEQGKQKYVMLAKAHYEANMEGSKVYQKLIETVEQKDIDSFELSKMESVAEKTAKKKVYETLASQFKDKPEFLNAYDKCLMKISIYEQKLKETPIVKAINSVFDFVDKIIIFVGVFVIAWVLYWVDNIFR
jgi:hypothetical protein